MSSTKRIQDRRGRARALWPAGGSATSAAAAVAAGCGGELPQSALDPSGPAAEAVLKLHWILTGLSVFVVLLVVGTLVYALFHRRDFGGRPPPLPLTPDTLRAQREAAEHGGEVTIEETDGPRKYIAQQTGAGMPERLNVDMQTAESDRRALPWVLGGGFVFPAVVLSALFVYTMLVMRDIGRPDASADVTIEVTGWQFWWEVQYFGEGGEYLFETANELHIPVGRRIAVELKAADVIHSFWVPRLAGKLDMIPGISTRLVLEAGEPGVYRGQCAEYCGLQHTNMAFYVVAHAEEDFAAWLAREREPAAEPAHALAAAGRDVFLSNSCRACHAIRGTPAVGELGPDLTHVARRLSLAAATTPNTRGHMGGWLADPQAIKPGVNMPAVPLGNEEFMALLHYMMSLE